MSKQRRTLRIPILNGAAVNIAAVFPMAPADWDHLMSVLEAMKPGLVEQKMGSPVNSKTGEPKPNVGHYHGLDSLPGVEPPVGVDVPLRPGNPPADFDG